MPTVKVYNMAGQQTGEMELNAAVFGIEPNVSAMHAVVKNHLANKRQGTQSTLTRAEVRGGGIKPWRQKGTGRARQGSIRAVQWIKGGVAFAPKPRDFSKKINKKMKSAAFRSAISYKVRNNELLVLDKVALEAAKTKYVAKILSNFNFDRKTLLVVGEKDDAVLLAGRNIERLTISTADLVNVYELVANTNVLATESAMRKIEEAYAE